ncbi:hypothetical protein A3A79_01830 [Candidatus Gottesmanbacteria bacterium RIFCSPLOWO2_01_FULL_43_11b]|uniref:Type II secretion system protein GspG C-terminal domain-containing protein n=1 Tax=Candidatus Gottesmanbacteria bacterium RIFCSPLOWO2_01_FULL_43_11b TaxID=1798392 RepID=A0A1F6AGN8_9BACT|nr:MAG: hypothetical protein A3A79_01830 [Candidatus Gottesmanbacteria bacterium RIFCSPLOWO2_01_FULL_43_11b]
MKNSKKGFSLIELLVVITIIAALVGVALPNFLGARQRAKDAKRKAELRELKSALRLYYNDFNSYPSGTGTLINGCGTTGTSACSQTGPFQAGPSGGETVYMKNLPVEYLYNRHPLKPTDTDDFLAKVVLENASDADIGASQARCGYPTPTPGEYKLCAD